MKHEYKKWVLPALFAIVCIEILIINIYLSRISELRNTLIPNQKKTHNECHKKLEEIKAHKDKSGGFGDRHKGIPQQGQFKEWAQKAGISTAPEVRQYPPRGNTPYYTSHITIREAEGASLFAFLKILDEIGGNNWIKELTITEHRGKSNKFMLYVTFATYVRSS